MAAGKGTHWYRLIAITGSFLGAAREGAGLPCSWARPDLQLHCACILLTADDHEVVISGTQSGLGIRIVGGQRAGSSHDAVLGIFIKEVVPGSLAERDGMPTKY